MDASIVQRLRDAEEDHRVQPGAGAPVVLRLSGGGSVTGDVVAVEDGAAYLQPGPDGAAVVVDLTRIVDLTRADLVGAARPAAG